MTELTESTPTSRSIILSTDEVRAVKAGKTVVRREILPKPKRKPFQLQGLHLGNLWFNENPSYPHRGAMMSMTWKCPFGAAGETIAVNDGLSVRVVSVSVERRDGKWEWCVGVEKV